MNSVVNSLTESQINQLHVIASTLCGGSIIVKKEDTAAMAECKRLADLGMLSVVYRNGVKTKFEITEAGRAAITTPEPENIGEALVKQVKTHEEQVAEWRAKIAAEKIGRGRQRGVTVEVPGQEKPVVNPIETDKEKKTKEPRQSEDDGEDKETRIKDLEEVKQHIAAGETLTWNGGNGPVMVGNRRVSKSRMRKWVSKGVFVKGEGDTYILA